MASTSDAIERGWNQLVNHFAKHRPPGPAPFAAQAMEVFLTLPDRGRFTWRMHTDTYAALMREAGRPEDYRPDILLFGFEVELDDAVPVGELDVEPSE